MHRPGHSRRSRRRELRSLHDGRRGTPGVRRCWADLVGRRGGLDEPTRVLPVVHPLLTLGGDWRSRRNAR